MNESKETFLVFNVPLPLNLGHFYLFAYDKALCTKEHASARICALQNHEFMGSFYQDILNDNQVLLLVHDDVQSVMTRIKTVVESAKRGVIIESMCGQFKLSDIECIKDFKGMVMKMIGDSHFDIWFDRHDLLENELVSS